MFKKHTCRIRAAKTILLTDFEVGMLSESKGNLINVLRTWALLALIVLTFGPCCAQPPVGLEALEQFADLPNDRQGLLVRQVSSTDPTGGNADGEGFLYQEDSLYVIFDQEGPGCVYRMWVRGTLTADTRKMLFYFDGESTPRINLRVQQLFSGFSAPFLLPLTNPSSISSGGYYSYLPVTYADHLKIAFEDDVEPYQITFATYEPGTSITSYTGLEDPSAVITQWENTGSDPKDPTGNIEFSDSTTIGLGATETIFSYIGEGHITGVRFRLDPVTISVLGSLKLRCYWDNSLTPQVESTFGSFFGNSLGQSDVDGLPIGVAGGEYYCFFPMPFWQTARIDLYNSSPNHSVDVAYTITYKTDPYPTESGYFNAVQRDFSYSLSNQDMVLGECAGYGNFVGISVTLNSQQWPDFLYGDLRVYLDAQAHPIIQGTDFDGDINAGNYFLLGTFTLPVHGVPAFISTFERKVNAYRFFLGDLIPFGNSIQILAEHGDRNAEPIEYSAVTFSYSRPEIALALSDHLDVGDPADETAHNYTTEGTQVYTSHYYAYPGSFDEEFFTDDGRLIYGSSSFTVAIDPQNEGVRLVRRKDASSFPQYAEVFVNTVNVGIWWDSEYNYYKRWGDSVFEIPAAYTQGQSQISVTIDPDSVNDWTECYYWIYSHIPPQPDITPPLQVTNLSAQSVDAGSQMLLQWDTGVDDLGVSRYQVYRGITAGVQPTEEFLVGQPILNSLTDQGLNPGTYYYYCVSAVDYSGNEGEASAEVAQRTSNNYMYEGEDIERFLGNSGDPFIVESMIQYGENWSSQHQLLYYSSNIGDYFAIPIDVAESDTYVVSGYFTMGDTYSNFRLYIDDVQLGSDVSLYAAQTIRSPQVEFGNRYLEAGEREFQFMVTGKNVASTDYWIGLDNLLLSAYSLMPVSPIKPQSMPHSFRLDQNHPNPFNAATRIHFSLPKAGITSVIIYDVQGRRVAVLQDAWLPGGQHTVEWKPSNLSSGVYLLNLKQDSRSAIRKILLLK